MYEDVSIKCLSSREHEGIEESYGHENSLFAFLLIVVNL